MMQHLKRPQGITPKCDIHTSQLDKFLTFDFVSHKSVTYMRHISGGKKFDHVRGGMKNVTYMCHSSWKFHMRMSHF